MLCASHHPWIGPMSPAMRRDHPWLTRLSALTLAVTMIYVLAIPEADARPKRLATSEVQELLTGNTVFGFNPADDSTYTMFHSGNGRVRAELRNVNGDISESGGRWWINDDGQLCVDWDNFRWVNSCATVVKDDDTITFQDENGRVISFGEVAKGNPDDI